jgi:hypothetical protein
MLTKTNIKGCVLIMWTNFPDASLDLISKKLDFFVQYTIPDGTSTANNPPNNYIIFASPLNIILVLNLYRQVHIFSVDYVHYYNHPLKMFRSHYINENVACM